MPPPLNDLPAYLAVIRGSAPRILPLTPGEFIAGRSPSAALSLTQLDVSRLHCRFIWNGKTCAVEDLGSAGGTQVNSKLISSRTDLQPGDQVQIGGVAIEFRRGEPPAAVEIEPEKAESHGLVLFRGQPTDRIEIQGELILGRDPTADIVFNDPGVSRRHASVRSSPRGGCTVTDLNSTAGSFVNGHRFESHDLLVGDRLQIGPFCFQYDGAALVRLAAAQGSSIEVISVSKQVPRRLLLDHVSFTIAPSQFVGILGPSGSGKTTLLTTLAGLNPPDIGRVLVDHENVYARHERSAFGYVPQDDIVHRELTVYQAIRFSAELRLPGATPDLEIQRLVLQTMDQLGLAALATQPITRLSGGQRKRVSVGVELLARPAVLFLDEPSSGLDPATEFKLMELLRGLADSGCTIVCTTHILENAYLMDQLLIVAAGALLFQGSAQEAREHFGVSKLVTLYDKLEEPGKAKEWKERLAANARQAPVELPPSAPPPARGHGQLQRVRRRFALPILWRRQITIFASDWRNTALAVAEPLVIALLVIWVTDDQALALFFAYLATLWFGCSNAAQEIVKEIPIFLREELVGVGTHSYLLCKVLFQTAIATAQGLIIYLCLIAGFRSPPLEGAAAWQIAAIIGIALASVGLGTAISALSRTMTQAILVVPLVLIPQILFSGYTVSASNMKPAVYWLARQTPTFAAQTLVDTSFLWEKRLAGEFLQDHIQSVANLKKFHPFKTGTVYEDPNPGMAAISTDVAWAIASYGVAWIALRRRARR